jgi:DNA mismatch endonuclease (patch repair protein)
VKCRAATTPKTNRHYWSTKFAENIARDKRNKRALWSMGFRVLTIWECQLKEDVALSAVGRRVERFVKGGSSHGPARRVSRKKRAGGQ